MIYRGESAQPAGLNRQGTYDIVDFIDCIRHLYCLADIGTGRLCTMASITIRNFDAELKERLRMRAARCGHSMEEEARIILRQALGGVTGPELLKKTQELFGEEHGAELELPGKHDNRAIRALDG